MPAKSAPTSRVSDYIQHSTFSRLSLPGDLRPCSPPRQRLLICCSSLASKYISSTSCAWIIFSSNIKSGCSKVCNGPYSKREDWMSSRSQGYSFRLPPARPDYDIISKDQRPPTHLICFIAKGQITLQHGIARLPQQHRILPRQNRRIPQQCRQLS